MRSERRASACCKKNIRPSAALVKQLKKIKKAKQHFSAWLLLFAIVVCYIFGFRVINTP